MYIYIDQYIPISRYLKICLYIHVYVNIYLRIYRYVLYLYIYTSTSRPSNRATPWCIRMCRLRIGSFERFVSVLVLAHETPSARLLTYICMYIYICVCVCVYVYMCVYIYSFQGVLTERPLGSIKRFVSVLVLAHVNPNPQAYLFVYINIYVDVRICIYTYIYTFQGVVTERPLIHSNASSPYFIHSNVSSPYCFLRMRRRPRGCSYICIYICVCVYICVYMCIYILISRRLNRATPSFERCVSVLVLARETPSAHPIYISIYISI